MCAGVRIRSLNGSTRASVRGTVIERNAAANSELPKVSAARSSPDWLGRSGL
jgi:hypothetical protein